MDLDFAKEAAQNLFNKKGGNIAPPEPQKPSDLNEPIEVQDDSSLNDETSIDEPKQEQTTEEPTVDAVEETVEMGEEGREKKETPAETKETTTETVDTDALREQLRAELSQEYEAKIKELESKSSESVFASPEIEKLNELQKAGIDVNSPDFWRWQAIDLDKFDTQTPDDAYDVVRLALELENPDLNENQIERLMKRSYPSLMSDDADEESDEYQEELTDLSIDATRKMKTLREHKQKVQLPKVNLADQEKQKAAAQKAREEFNMAVKQQVNSYKAEKLKLDEGLEIDFNVTPESKKFIESSIINNETFFQDNYVTEKGVDFGRLQRDMLRLAEFDNIVSTVYKQGISKGRDEVADTLENASTDVQKKKKQVLKSKKEQAVDSIVNRWKQVR